MNARTVKFGILVGLVGGMGMAMWSMMALAVTGHGFWTPVNLIAHTFWKGAPLGGAFSMPALAIGMGVHLMISMAIGLVMAVLVEHRVLDGLSVVTVGLVLGMGAWAVQAFAWPALDSSASSTFTPWVFAVAHMMFAVGAAMMLLRLEHRRSGSALVAPVASPATTRRCPRPCGATPASPPPFRAPGGSGRAREGGRTGRRHP